MDEDNYKDAYQKFKSTAIEGMISGREDSIVKTVDELKNIIGQE